MCKPYNSALGEHFRAHWDVVPSVYALDISTLADPAAEPYTSEPCKFEESWGLQERNLETFNQTTKNDDLVRVIFLTEQVSHHAPVSAYFASCSSRSIKRSGIDKITAKISGTTLRVAPGQLNQGIFIKLTGGYGEGERYQITHPVASVNGILRGSFYVTVGETTIITCEDGKPGSKLRTIIDYKEEVGYILTNLIEPFFLKKKVVVGPCPLPR